MFHHVGDKDIIGHHCVNESRFKKLLRLLLYTNRIVHIADYSPSSRSILVVFDDAYVLSDNIIEWIKNKRIPVYIALSKSFHTREVFWRNTVRLLLDSKYSDLRQEILGIPNTAEEFYKATKDPLGGSRIIDAYKAINRLNLGIRQNFYFELDDLRSLEFIGFLNHTLSHIPLSWLSAERDVLKEINDNFDWFAQNDIFLNTKVLVIPFGGYNCLSNTVINAINKSSTKVVLMSNITKDELTTLSAKFNNDILVLRRVYAI